jgi:TIR domain
MLLYQKTQLRRVRVEDWMKIFISWSGSLSRSIAEILRDWLPSVLQTVEPYVSSEDIHKGARWSVDVFRELEAANYGILCVTKTNIDAPWLNFEAGALSKSFEKGHVSPFLFDIEPSNVTGPLLQFQSTVYEKEDVFKLIKSINTATGVPLEMARVESAFSVVAGTKREARSR